MRKKLITMVFVLLCVLIILLPSVLGVTLTKNLTQQKSISQSPEKDSNPLSSLTLQQLKNLLIDYIHKSSLSFLLKQQLLYSINQGLNELQHTGIVSFSHFCKTSTNLPKGILGFNGLSRHFILLNIDPDTVKIRTTLPPEIQNISGDNATLEIFIKLYPYRDSIQTTQTIIIRKLYQETSVLLPAIGARIIQNNITTFIIAFGLGMRREWKFF